MPGATPEYGLPYPLGGETVNVPADIEALATAVENLLAVRVQRGTKSVSVTAANTPSTTRVDLPTPMPDGVVPAVFLTGHLVVPHLTQTLGVAGESNTGFSIVFERTDTAATITVDWIAVGL